MNYGAIKTADVANGPGVRVTLFVSGCTHHCRECFQPETWDFSYGEEFTEETQQELLKELSPDYIAGLTLLGGEPFEPANQRALLPFLRRVRDTFPRKTIWVFTGYLFEELAGYGTGTGRARCEVTDEMLSLLDVLVDGEFMIDKKDIRLRFRGSSNQRLLDVKQSLAQKKAVWWDDESQRR